MCFQKRNLLAKRKLFVILHHVGETAQSRLIYFFNKMWGRKIIDQNILVEMAEAPHFHRNQCICGICENEEPSRPGPLAQIFNINDFKALPTPP